jgi:hypothetical protein
MSSWFYLDAVTLLAKSKEIHQLDLRIISGKADCVRHRVKAKNSKIIFLLRN